MKNLIFGSILIFTCLSFGGARATSGCPAIVGRFECTNAENKNDNFPIFLDTTRSSEKGVISYQQDIDYEIGKTYETRRGSRLRNGENAKDEVSMERYSCNRAEQALDFDQTVRTEMMDFEGTTPFFTKTFDMLEEFHQSVQLLTSGELQIKAKGSKWCEGCSAVARNLLGLSMSTYQNVTALYLCKAL